MGEKSIYSLVLEKECFSQLKEIRNRWVDSQLSETRVAEKDYLPANLCNLGGSDYESYSFVMSQASNCIYQSICKIIFELLVKHHREVIRTSLKREDAYHYPSKDTNQGPVQPLASSRSIHAFIVSDAPETRVYVIKEFGIGERLPQYLEQLLKDSCGASKVVYVSLVFEKAEREYIGGSSGSTDTISLYQLFNAEFSLEDFEEFHTSYRRLMDSATKHYGLRIAKSLQHMEFGHFKRDLLREVQEHDYVIAAGGKRVDPAQKEIIDEAFLHLGTCEAVTGSADFATSFATAEWMRRTLQGSTNIDLTPVALGYFKAIEQFLFLLVQAFSLDPKGTPRELYVGKWDNNTILAKGNESETHVAGIPVVNGHVNITDRLFSEQFKYVLDLGRLTKFFGDRDQGGNYYHRNTDLLRADIDKDTYEVIILTLQGLRNMRNGYLHKDNMRNWAEVEKVREQAFLLFYLMLGAYKLSEYASTKLDIGKRSSGTDYYRLCRYIDEASRRFENPFERPVFYLEDDSADADALLACSDNEIMNYDRYGEPLSYSGIYLKRLGSRSPYDIKCGRDNLPSQIFEGKLIIGSPNSEIPYRLTGPQKLVFRNGRFNA